MVYVGERLVPPGFPRLSRYFHEVGDHETADKYVRIHREALAHIVFGRTVLRRLRGRPEHAEVVVLLREGSVSQAYRAVRAARPRLQGGA
jgi:hypothetical protein